MPDKLTKLYLDYVDSNNQLSFSKLYTSLSNILKSKFRANAIFKNTAFIYEFEDVFQLTMIKLATDKTKFNPDKGNIVAYTYMIFLNMLIDKKRQHKENIRLDLINF